RSRVFCEMRIARAPLTARSKPVQLSVDEQNIGRLRNDNILTGELLLQPHRAAISAHAHGASGVKTNQCILRATANRNRLNLKQIGRAHVELQSPDHLVCRLLLEKK